MRTSMRVKHFVAPALLTLAALGLGTGCSSAKNALGGTCGGDSGLSASLDAFGTAVTNLQTLEANVTGTIGAACAKIATDLGSTKTLASFTPGQKASSDDVTAACTEANAQLKAAFSAATNAGATVTVTVTPPVCEVDASAQLQCQANCNVEANCTTPDITAESDPGNLSGTCSAQCHR